MQGDVCRLCGGDGRIGNALGRSSATCPGCHGSGRRADTSAGFHDVTKTKPSHHHPPAGSGTGSGSAKGPAAPKGPATPEGLLLAQEVNASTVLPAEAKTRLIAEIANHESTHGRCTKTFIKKVRKQAHPGQ